MALSHLYLGSLNVCTELLGPAKTVAMVALSSSCASRRSSPKHCGHPKPEQSLHFIWDHMVARIGSYPKIKPQGILPRVM